MALHTPAIHNPVHIHVPGRVQATLALVAVVLVAALVVVLMPRAERATVASNHASADYQAFRVGERMPLAVQYATPAEAQAAWQAYRAGERWTLANQQQAQFEAWQAYRAGERWTLANQQQAQFEAWQAYRAGERSLE